jgi:cell division protease FtsH
MGDKQQFSIWYFFISLTILVVLQTYILVPRPETISYSQFKTLVKRKLVTNLAVGHETISGDIKAEGVKQGLSGDAA